MNPRHAVTVCRSKRRFATKKRAAGRAMQIRDTSGYGFEMHPYLCRVCKGWHLTSQRPEEKAS